MRQATASARYLSLRRAWVNLRSTATSWYGGSRESFPRGWASRDCPRRSRSCSKPPASRHDGPDWLAKIELQPLTAGDFEVAVVEAEEVEHRGVDVGDVVAVFRGVEAEFVGRAVDDAGFNAAA